MEKETMTHKRGRAKNTTQREEQHLTLFQFARCLQGWLVEESRAFSLQYPGNTQVHLKLGEWGRLYVEED